MRIALITRRFPPLIGGAEKVLSYLAPALAAQGAEVTVLTSRLNDLPAEESIGGAKVVRLETSSLRFFGTWQYMRNLRRWLETHPVDVAYVSMMKHDAYVAVGVGKKRGFPVVLRPEGAGATGDVTWQAWGRGGKEIATRCKQADAFVAISEAVRRELIDAGYDPAKIVDLPNGVPVPGEIWVPRHRPSGPKAVFVGRLAVEKGLDTLIHAWRHVKDAFPDPRLILVGEGPERSKLEALIGELGLSECVSLPGIVSDPSTISREADFFVLPSHEEGMSIALLEAMALGIPVIASDIPGNRKLVESGVHGSLVPPGDPTAWAEVICKQFSHLETAIAQGATARERVIVHYSIAAVARSHLELFARLIRG